MIVTIGTNYGDLKLDIPYSCSEITFSKFCDFNTYRAKMYEDTDSDDILIEVVNQIITVIEGDISFLDYGVNENAEDLFNDEFTLSIGDDINLIRLYVHLCLLLDNYQPLKIYNTYHLHWKNEDYYIESNQVLRLLEAEKSYTVGEVIELKNFQLKFGRAIKKGDQGGNLEFSLGLHELAVILRKDGEQLPSNVNKRNKFIKKRIREFEDLPMTEVFNIRYFFLSTLKIFVKTKATNIFLKEKKKYILERLRSNFNKENMMPNGKPNWIEHLVLLDGKFTTP